MTDSSEVGRLTGVSAAAHPTGAAGVGDSSLEVTDHPWREVSEVEAEHSFREMCNEIVSGVAITDFEGRHLYANTALGDFVAISLAENAATAPPAYVPRDQHRQFWQAISTIESGANSAAALIELAGRHFERVLVHFTVLAWRDSDRPALLWLARDAYECATNENLGPRAPLILDDGGDGGTANGTEGAREIAHGLTAREHEVVRALLEGRRVGSIARALSVSEHTVRSHLTSIFRKLDVHSQDEVIARFRRIRADNAG